jgi:hypothetical protein
MSRAPTIALSNDCQALITTDGAKPASANADFAASESHRVEQSNLRALFDDSKLWGWRSIPSRLFHECKSKRLYDVWMLSPLFDLLFICGLAPWILGFVSYFIVGALTNAPRHNLPQTSLTLAFIVASFVIGESHQFTSIIRYYSKFRYAKLGVKARFPFWFIYSLIIGTLVIVATPMSGFPPIDLIRGPLGLTIMFVAAAFPAVLMLHICAQVNGVFLRYCQMNGYSMSKIERRGLTLLSWMLAGTGALYMAVPFMMQPFDNDIVQLAISVSATATAVAVLYTFFRRLATGAWPPAPAIVLWCNMTLYALLPFYFVEMRYVWLFVPLLFHATQHWTIAFKTQHEERARLQKVLSNSFADDARWVLPIQFVTLLVLFLPILVPFRAADFIQSSDQIFGTNTLTILPSMAVFYLHFFADRVVWRPIKT